MKRPPMFALQAVAAIGVAASLSLQGYGVQNPLCREWSDGCSICARDDSNAPHCSTPGVACQPASIECRRETTK